VINDTDTGTSISCTAATSGSRQDISTCTAPTGLSQFKDPSTPGTACSATVGSITGTCQYSLTQADGTVGSAKTNNYEVATYLEAGTGNLPSGISCVSSENTTVTNTGCQ